MEKNILIIIISMLFSIGFEFDVFTSYGIICFIVTLNEVTIWLLERINQPKEKNPLSSDQE